jgi:hypothetical protein
VQAHDRQLRDDRERLVDAAIADGRVAPARREGWLNMLATDPGAADTLASLERGLIPVGRAIGHSGNGEQAEDPDQRIQRGRELYGRRYGKTA